MSDETPTTEQVRNNFALGVAFAARVENPTATAGDVTWPEPGFRDRLKVAFDAWLAEHDWTVAERAWDEARQKVRDAHPMCTEECGACIARDEVLDDLSENPYRAVSE